MLPVRPILEYASVNPGAATPTGRWQRVSIAVGVLLAWFVPSMAGASANTSWEHHPFAGAFIILKESNSLRDFAFSLGLWACILTPAGYWIRSGKIWAAAIALVICCASAGLSCFIAALASC